MEDIAAGLRAFAESNRYRAFSGYGLLLKAADEIERLRTFCPCLGQCFCPSGTPDSWAEMVAARDAEIERLRKWQQEVCPLLVEGARYEYYDPNDHARLLIEAGYEKPDWLI